jgi:hypothetical protein
MSDLFDAPINAEIRAAVLIATHLKSGGPLSRADLNTAMTEAFHGTDADGLWTQRQSFELLELALVHHLQSAPYPLRVLDDAHAACDLLDRLPTQSVRSEEPDRAGSSSRPPRRSPILSALAVLNAYIQADDVILEPSAGNRPARRLRQRGAHAALHPQRRSPPNAAQRLLHAAFPERHGHRAMTAPLIDDFLPRWPGAARPTLVLINPPFSRSASAWAQDDPHAACLRHLQAARRCAASAPGGRLRRDPMPALASILPPHACAASGAGLRAGRRRQRRASVRLEKCLC